MAAAVGISTRQLSRVFAQDGVSLPRFSHAFGAHYGERPRDVRNAAGVRDAARPA